MVSKEKFFAWKWRAKESILRKKKSFMSKPMDGEGNLAQTWDTEAKYRAADWNMCTRQECE